jgi:hypothetical protein
MCIFVTRLILFLLPSVSFLIFLVNKESVNQHEHPNIIQECILINPTIFSLVTICDLIVIEQTKFSARVHPAFSYALFIRAITWLTMVERVQASLVGLIPVNKENYKDSYATLTVVICCFLCEQLCRTTW